MWNAYNYLKQYETCFVPCKIILQVNTNGIGLQGVRVERMLTMGHSVYMLVITCRMYECKERPNNNKELMLVIRNILEKKYDKNHSHHSITLHQCNIIIIYVIWYKRTLFHGRVYFFLQCIDHLFFKNKFRPWKWPESYYNFFNFGRP